MRDVVIVEAVRTPIGKCNGGLSTMHSADLLGLVQREVVQRAGIDPELVGQIVGGCVSQAGMQSYNVTRMAWLAAGLPRSTAGQTLDSACGSSQQALNLSYALVAAGVIDCAVACGVEIMSRVPLGASLGTGIGKAVPKSYFARYEYTTQFQGGERIAAQWGLTRRELDELGVESQAKLARASAEDRFAGQVVGVDAPVLEQDGKPTGEHTRVERDEGLRETTLDGLAALKPTMGEGGFHTAGTSSQISDGAAAVLVMARETAEAHGLRARARIVDTCLVGSDPVLMLTGPIDATRHLLARTGLSIDDIDVFEINEAFGSVILAWERECKPRHDAVNPNGGAIAHGHPLGGTGVILTTKAVHELERSGSRRALVSMCCGGGMATGTILERL